MTPTFLVPSVAKRLVRQARGPIEPAKETGAVLYCDLVGYSRRGAETIARSDRGAEDLRAEINTTFEKLCEQITQLGGEILYFAGDAIAAFWADGKGSTSAVAKAVSAGDAIRNQNSEHNDGFLIKTGVTYGDLWVVDIALNNASRLPVFCGSALHALARLDLSSSEVALSDVAKAHTEEPALQDKQTQVESDQQINLDPWVQPFIRAGLSQGEEWLAEFRNARVMFARLEADPISDQSSAATVAERLQACANAVLDEQGTLLQVCRDDKGLIMVAAWGLSSSASEKGAERAVMAAQRVCDVGGNAALCGGKIFSGLIGSPSYMQYVGVGDAINRAASLCIAAPAQVTLDEGTAHAVSERFETAAIREFVFKGHQDTSVVYGIVAERAGTLSHAGDLIGRTQEQKKLRRFIQAVQDGARADLAIVAEAGIGKSRLLDWVSENLTATQQTHLRLKGDSLRRAVSYAPIAPLLRKLLKLDSTSSLEECQRALAVLPEQSQDLHALLNQVLPAAHPETKASRALTGPGRAEATRDLILQLFAHLLPGKSLLLIEDAHWLDSATWQVLDAITRSKDVSLLMVMRPVTPDDLPTEAHRFLDPSRIEIVALEPLDKAASSQLAAQAIGAKELAQALEQLVFDKATGHPLFTTALTQTLHIRGLIEVQDGYAHLRLGEKSLVGLSIPSEVSGAVGERIGSLSPSEQLTLKTASVLGRTFSQRALNDLHPTALETDIGRDLAEIEKTGLIERDDAGDWQFQHAIVSDAAYDSLTREQSRTLHGRVALNIQNKMRQNTDQASTVLLAYHAERAGDHSVALKQLQIAAENARASYANLEVIEFLTRALALAGTDTAQITIAQWQFHMAYAMRALGQYQKAEDFLTKCITQLDRSPPTSKGQALRALLGGFVTFRVSPHRAEQPEDIRAPIILAADATMMLSEIHYELNKIPFALSEILRGANLAHRAGGDSATLAKLYIGMSLISTSLPWALDGDKLQNRALEIVDRMDDPATEAWVYMVSGNFEAGKAGWDRGAAHFSHSMDVSEAVGERKTWETSASTMGNLKRLEGHFAQAKQWSDLTLAHSRDRGVMQGIIWSHNGRARDLLCLSEWDEMREDVSILARLMDDPANANDANDNNRMVFHYARATLAFADGDTSAALKALDDALEIVARTARPQVYMTQNAAFYSDLIWGFWHSGAQGPDLLARHDVVHKSACRIARQYRAGHPIGLLVAGDNAWLKGKPKDAEKAWRASVASAQERAMFYSAAHAMDRLVRTDLSNAREDRDQFLGKVDLDDVPRLWRLGV